MCVRRVVYTRTVSTQSRLRSPRQITRHVDLSPRSSRSNESLSACTLADEERNLFVSLSRSARTFLQIYLRLVSVLTKRTLFNFQLFHLVASLREFRVSRLYLLYIRPSRARPRRAVMLLPFSVCPSPSLYPSPPPTLARLPPLISPSTDALRAALRLIPLIAFTEHVTCVPRPRVLRVFVTAVKVSARGRKPGVWVTGASRLV